MNHLSGLTGNCYHNISKCLSFYSNKATYIDTPWIVKSEVRDETFIGDDVFEFSNKTSLVGSAEQGFIALEKENKLDNDKLYISVGPCFRSEPVVDELHKLYFLKAELFYCSKNIYNIQLEFYNILKLSGQFFNSLISKKDKLDFIELYKDKKVSGRYQYSNILEEKSTIDAMLNYIEIGSYGIRHMIKNNEKYYFIYGTALAEPRFSMALRSKG